MKTAEKRGPHPQQYYFCKCGKNIVRVFEKGEREAFKPFEETRTSIANARFFRAFAILLSWAFGRSFIADENGEAVFSAMQKRPHYKAQKKRKQ
ncbi:hypothetical protein FACS189490_00380 [Clostridia bacterium]|nr:hypothetical protein FACS189490_00380 [Clostridia bacterium]